MAEPTRRTATRRSPRGEAARQTILEAATRLFSGGGFNTVSIADIAKDVGMTQAGVLHHFPSKSNLLLAVLLEREARNDRETAAEREKGLDNLTVFLHTLRNNDRNPPLVQLMTLLSSESIPDSHPAHDYFAARYAAIARTTTAYLEPMLDHGALPEDVDAETIARWIIAMADGLRLQWLYDQDAVSRKHSLARFYDTLRPFLREPYRSHSWVDALAREDAADPQFEPAGDPT